MQRLYKSAEPSYTQVLQQDKIGAFFFASRKDALLEAQVVYTAIRAPFF
jgi:hypothetical protein